MTLRINVRSRVSDRIPRDAEARLNRGMRDAVSDGTESGWGLTRALTPKRRPYTFSTVEQVVLGGGSHVEGHFGSDDRIFGYLEEGTRPHIIRPRFARALFWPGARHPVMSVNHPGTQPYAMLEEAGPVAGAVTKAGLRQAMAAVFS